MDDSIKRTIPNFYYEYGIRGIKNEIYLDGLSKGIHGNPKRQWNDPYIMTYFRSHGNEVMEIASSDLDDPKVMNMHFKNIINSLSLY